MAANDTYQTKVYHEQGGDRLVANSGGTIAIESGGSIAFYDSTQFTIETSVNIAFAGEDLGGDDLRRVLISEQAVASIGFEALAVVLVSTNIPKNIGVYTIYASDAATDETVTLRAVSAGKEMYLILAGDATGTFTNTLTTIKVSGSDAVWFLGSLGNKLSHFLMNVSGNSDCMVHLIAPYDDFWAIVHSRGDIDEETNV